MKKDKLLPGFLVKGQPVKWPVYGRNEKIQLLRSSLNVVPTALVSNHFQEDLKRLYSLKDIYESYLENHKPSENEK